MQQKRNDNDDDKYENNNDKPKYNNYKSKYNNKNKYDGMQLRDNNNN